MVDRVRAHVARRDPGHVRPAGRGQQRERAGRDHAVLRECQAILEPLVRLGVRVPDPPALPRARIHDEGIHPLLWRLDLDGASDVELRGQQEADAEEKHGEHDDTDHDCLDDSHVDPVPSRYRPLR